MLKQLIAFMPNSYLIVGGSSDIAIILAKRLLENENSVINQGNVMVRDGKIPAFGPLLTNLLLELTFPMYQ